MLSGGEKEVRTIKVFLGGISDEKRVFEVIRMSVGLTLRGIHVHLFVSPDALKSIERMQENFKKEVEEFFEAIRYMGGKIIITSDFSAFSIEEADFEIVAVGT